jgi:hypothetical protein
MPLFPYPKTFQRGFSGGGVGETLLISGISAKENFYV